MKITKSNGKVVKNQKLNGTKTVNTWYSFKWKAGSKGTYKYYVHGQDLAGNASKHDRLGEDHGEVDEQASRAARAARGGAPEGAPRPSRVCARGCGGRPRAPPAVVQSGASHNR